MAARSRRIATIAGSLACGLIMATSAFAADPPRVTLRAEMGFAAQHPVVTAGWPAFTEAVGRDSGGGLRFTRFVSNALTGGEDSLERLAGGDADIGAVEPARFPSIFPHASLVADLAPFGADPLAAAAAVTEFTLLRCVPCLTAWRDRNLVPLGTYAAPPYVLLTARPVERPESLRDRRIWSPGGIWDRWLRSLGAQPMAGPPAIGRGMATNAIDGAIDTPLALHGKAARRSVQGIYDLPLGSFQGMMPFVVNGDTWRKLSQRHRSAVLIGAPVGLIAITRAYRAEAGKALTEAGTPAPVSPPALAEQTRQFMDAELQRLAAAADERYGVPDGPEILATLKTLYTKYAALLAPPNDAPYEATVVLRREIFSKLDAKTFGMAPPRPDN